MKKKHASKVVAVEGDTSTILLDGKEQSISNNLFAFEALVGDEVWVTFDQQNTIVQVEQKDFSREYALSDGVEEGKTVPLFVSPERKVE